MIEKISFKNFKAFKELRDLELKPITILCGKNSCGKSSIFQSILLFKQSLESQDPNLLLLNGKYVHLGIYENIIYDRDINNILEFEFDFKVPKSVPRRGTRSYSRSGLPILYYFRDFISREDLKNYGNSIEFKFQIKLKLDQLGDGSEHKLSTFSVKYMRIKFKDLEHKKEVFIGPYAILEHKEKNKFKVECYRISELHYRKNKTHTGTFELNVNNFYKFIPESRYIETKDKEIPISIRLIFHRVQMLISYIFSYYGFIGPLREEPSRRYIYEDEILEIGNKGENAAYLFLNEQEKILKNHYFFDKEKDSLTKKESLRLDEALYGWFDFMNIKNFKASPYKEIIYLFLNSSNSKDLEVNIADVGFGVSQVFPILLEGLRMPKMNTLILEQPEIHLHPELQAKMADFFISLALSDKNVLIETHSEHIINRIVRRILEDDSDNLANMINIYFIKSSENGANYEKIQIDKIKGVLNWPKGFFDQYYRETQKIIYATFQNEKKQQKNGNSNG